MPDDMKAFMEKTDSLKTILQDGVRVHNHGASMLQLPAAEVGHEAATYFDVVLHAFTEELDGNPSVCGSIAMVSAHTTRYLFTLLFYSGFCLHRYCGPLCRAAQKSQGRQQDQQV